MKKYSILFVLVATLLFSCGKDPEKPTVSTLDVVDIALTSAKVNAKVESDGGAEVTERGIEYACASFSEPDHDCHIGKIYAGSGVGEYQCEISDLEESNTYYVRAFATNEAGTSYGEEVSFTTLENDDNDEEGNTINGYEFVDLGLPSGIKWATHNVGATEVGEVGAYYAWGEIKSKDEFYADNSLTFGVPLGDFSGNPEYDVAAASWGSTWRMPTEANVLELRDNCTVEWTVIGIIPGAKVIGPNGNHIFLPSGGFMTNTSIDFYDSESAYWTSTQDTSNGDLGYATFFYLYNTGFCNRGWMSRYVGMLVRPVSD